MKLTKKVQSSLDGHLEAYLSDRRDSGYLPAGVRSIEQRLSRVMHERLINGDPSELSAFLLQNYAKNSIKSIFSDVINFWEYLVHKCIVDKSNPYSEFRHKNSKNGTFSGGDMPKKVGVSYQEAWSRVKNIKNESIRIRALELLSTGLRFSDAQRCVGQNCIQKGGQSKPINGLAPGQLIRPFYYSYSQFLRTLKKETDLNPHDLRRLVASHLYEDRELDPIQIQQWLGHKNINTTMRYIQASKLENITLSLGEIA